MNDRDIRIQKLDSETRVERFKLSKQEREDFGTGCFIGVFYGGLLMLILIAILIAAYFRF